MEGSSEISSAPQMGYCDLESQGSQDSDRLKGLPRKPGFEPSSYVSNATSGPAQPEGNPFGNQAVVHLVCPGQFPLLGMVSEMSRPLPLGAGGG